MTAFEDIEIGTRRELGRFTFTAEEIKRFARKYDPQPFHVDEEAAKRSHFGGLIASGWHTASVYMKLLSRDMAQCGMTLDKTGVSPGFRNMRWLKPVFAGDALTYSTEFVSKRELASRPGWGIVFSKNSAVNQHGELVFEFEGSVLYARRG